MPQVEKPAEVDEWGGTLMNRTNPTRPARPTPPNARPSYHPQQPTLTNSHFPCAQSNH
jgi:hypothetical protein